MDWMEMLKQIFQVCIIPLLGILTVYIVKFINAKSEELKATANNELYYLEVIDKVRIFAVKL